jgi:hypothetical protein
LADSAENIPFLVVLPFDEEPFVVAENWRKMIEKKSKDNRVGT